MRQSLLLLAVFAAGCASSGSSSETLGQDRAILVSPGDGTIVGEGARSVSTSIAAPAATVYVAAKKVYTDLEIPLTIDSPMEHRLGNSNYVKSRQLGGQSMADFVSCGNGPEGLKASYYRMYLSIVTDVAPDGPNTKVQTLVQATGQDMGGNATDRISCVSTGRLELLIAEKIKAALAKP